MAAVLAMPDNEVCDSYVNTWFIFFLIFSIQTLCPEQLDKLSEEMISMLDQDKDGQLDISELFDSRVIDIGINMNGR